MDPGQQNRLIQDRIKQPLAEELLFGKLSDGGEVHLTIKDNKPSFELTPAPPKTKTKRKPAKKAATKKLAPKDDAAKPEESGSDAES